MEFSYQARDNEGNFRTGTVEAATEANAFEALQGHGLIVVKILPSNKVNFLERVKIFERVTPKELVLFSRQLATLINAKVPIVQALRMLETQITSGKLKTVTSEIAQRVESGDSLSAAIARHPKVFSELYVNLMRAGELSGTLDESLGYLANQLERDYDLRSKVIGAMTYPIFILVTLGVVGILMFLYVLPPLINVLNESSVALPITTQALIAVTNIIQNFWWLIILVIGGGVISYRYYSKTVAGKYVVDTLKMKVPIFGNLYKKVYMARFARNLSTLIAGGIPIVRALQTVSDIVGNVVYRDIILEASHQVSSGKSIASALIERKEFPPIVAQMTQVGETTGRLHEILEKLASYYEKEVEEELKVLTTLLEPMIMIILGFAVAVMVAGILLPIYNLAGAS